MKLYFKHSYVWEEFFFNFILYFNFKVTSNILLADIIIFNNFSLEDRKFLIKNKNIWNSKKFFCYIHEPLIDNKDAAYNSKMIRRLQQFNFINIITYSKTNINFINKNKFFLDRKIFYLPINYYYFKDLNFNKNIDGLILHRNIINKNKDNHNENIFPSHLVYKHQFKLLNCWNKERDILFNNSKIFINLHKKFKVNFLETLRIHNLIYNRVIIISESCYDYNDDLSKYVIFTNDLENTYEKVLNNYEDYYKNIYGNLTNKQIFEPINHYYFLFSKFIFS